MADGAGSIPQTDGRLPTPALAWRKLRQLANWLFGRKPAQQVCFRKYRVAPRVGTEPLRRKLLRQIRSRTMPVIPQTGTFG